MKFFKPLLVLAVIASLAFTSVHKYYVSITKIEYVKEKQSVQIITRIFIDDFERLLKERYNNKIVLDASKDETQIDSYIKKYLLSRLKININEKESVIKFIGKEYDDDVVQCYLEIEDVTNVKSFSIENSVLYDMFSEQKNIVRTHINGKHKSFILIPENDKGMLNF
ncbi:DUF6702 family protein [Lacinutrix sp. Bg11-31]|uniref:DUF6702 family protein n=1 Tax=Lacinutrix sp. Bg11-31 TaxID=2057808 RepID=UPI000C30C55D|nr:DUF6702 family protein [Lacinutrix sp. Bg11-31]AUC83490.1 peptidase E [Lacinutrix sp. Bg11-31]